MSLLLNEKHIIHFMGLPVVFFTFYLFISFSRVDFWSIFQKIDDNRLIEKFTDDDFDSKIIDDRLVESKVDLVSVSDRRAFMSEVLYLHQTFSDYVSD